jgi:hypothetical protein
MQRMLVIAAILACVSGTPKRPVHSTTPTLWGKLQYLTPAKEDLKLVSSQPLPPIPPLDLPDFVRVEDAALGGDVISLPPGL